MNPHKQIESTPATVGRQASATDTQDALIAAARPARIRRLRQVVVALAAITGFGSGVYFLAIHPRIQNKSGLAAAAAKAEKKTVTVVQPRQTNQTAPLILPGNIQAERATSIYSRIDGYLSKWYVDIGDRVQQGQVLADIEAPQIDANLRTAQAQLELAQANWKLAQANSARSRQLSANHVISQQELDTVLATEQVQQANVNNAAAQLKDAQEMKAYEQVRAPFSGIISARYVEVGSLVTSGSASTVQKLFDISQSDLVRVFVNAPQADVSRIQSGASATVTVDEYPGETFSGKVTRDAGAFDQSSRTILLEVDVPNPTGRLYAGMYAHVSLSLPNPNPTLYLPDNTLLIDSKGTRVATVDTSNKIHFKDVKLGRDFGAETEILSGITSEEQVVQNPTDDLREGTTVSVQPAAVG
jgi:membrane fusion protein, multidrug efflux system